jgi:integrase
MPKHDGVYRDGKGRWYFKARVGRDPLTGKWQQVTRRGFATAAEAVAARRTVLDGTDSGRSPTARGLTVDQLLDLYLDDLDTSERVSAKTRFSYRNYADSYVRPWIGQRPVTEITPTVVAAWQARLAAEGGTKTAKALSANTVRLARSPLAGAFKYGIRHGLVAKDPITGVARPKAQRSVPRHWSPEQAREFLALTEGDRLWPLWAFLLGSGLRIGELVWLRWPNVDLARQSAHIVEFATTLGYKLVASEGKSRDAWRTIELDTGLVQVLRQQRKLQAEEQIAATDYEATDYVFTKPNGGAYHPQWLSRHLGVLSTECGLPRLTAHGLRHTSATLMLASGVHPKVAAERLGHADTSLFSNLYSHVTPTMQREAAQRIGDALFGDTYPPA